MKDYIVSTQEEYDRTVKNIASLKKRPFYDIGRNKGTEIAGEISSLMYPYLFEGGDKDRVYGGLSFFNFDKLQADEIIRYFQEHPPRDMPGIERGLTILHIIPRDYDENQPDEDSKIVIKDSKEKIIVRSNVEVYGKSFVEAFGDAFITAKDDAYIIARDTVSAEAYHTARVDAYDQSRIRAFDNALVTASGESRVMAYHKSCVMAGGKAKVMAYHDAYINSLHDTDITAFDKSTVVARGNSRVTAYNNSHITACGASEVSAYNLSFVHASDMSKTEARNRSCVFARENALVTGSDDSLVFIRDNARSKTFGNSSSIEGKDNNAENLRKNILAVMRHSRFSGDPVTAVRMLMLAVPEENRAEINRKLLAMGCTGPARTKNILGCWVKARGEDVSRER